MKSLTIFIAIVYFHSSAALYANSIGINDGSSSNNQRKVRQTSANSLNISLHANGWITKYPKDAENVPEVINGSGLVNWATPKLVVSVYFYSSIPGEIDVSLICLVPSGTSKLKLSIGGTRREVEVTGSQYQVVEVGKFQIDNSSYTKFDMEGISKTGQYYADVSYLMISGDLVNPNSITYIRELPDFVLNFKRRGPAPNLQYQLSVNNAEYYYIEMKVPCGFDPIGSIYNVILFNYGWVSFQVINETSRYVTLAVSTTSLTNKVEVVSKGANVIVGNLSDSGTNCTLNYKWSSGTTYKILVHGRPDPLDSTKSIFSAWFAEKNHNWKFIASLKDPEFNGSLQGFSSSNNNINPKYSYLTQKSYYGNQWIYDLTGNWQEVTSGVGMIFPNVRLDAEIGVENQHPNEFYMINDGFSVVNNQFYNFRGLNPVTNRTANNIKPNIEFDKLPKS